MTTATTKTNGALKSRFDRAIEGLKNGLYTVEGPRKIGQLYEWTVVNTNTTYTVTFNKNNGFNCECPDFAKRGSVCKHIIMVRATYDLRHDLKHTPLGELLADAGIVETLWDTVQQMAGRVTATAQQVSEPTPPPADEPPAPTPPSEPPSNGTASSTGNADGELPELPEAATVMPWGKYKGRTFGEMVQDPDAAGYLLWLAKKWEPREKTEEAERLKVSARTVLEAWASRQADAVMDGKAPMPTVPFGEDKGKPLSGPGACHPKWVAVLAKKGFDDAWGPDDLVLYEVARRLKSKMNAGRRGGRGGCGGMTDEAARELAAAIRELAAAIRENSLSEDTLAKAIQRGLTQATVHHLPLG